MFNSASRRTRTSALLLCAAVACVTFVPQAAAAEKPVSLTRTGLTSLDRVAAWSSPRVDVQQLRRQDEANRGRFDIPYRIGFPMSTDLSPKNSGTWEQLPGGDRLWRLRVSSEGALWVVLGFDVFRLQEGGKLWVYDPAAKTVLGPHTTADTRDHGELWFQPVAGSELVVELFWPAKLRAEDPRIHLGTVSHGYKPFGTIGASLVSDPTEGFGDSGACNVDVACPLGANWQDEKRGVVILLSGGSGFCSASLINTTADDCRPYVLTAAHCTAGVSTVFGFNFERPACNSGIPPPETTYVVTGATVLANYASSDFTLLQMSGPPPESFAAYFNGWSRDTLPATNTIAIHHPRGDAKKITRDDQAPFNGTNWGPNHWRIAQYEEGTTEPGSSGSPLFDQNHRIVGQLHGGAASCTVIDYDEYGKVDASWVGGGTAASRLSDWLDPLGTGAIAMDGIDHSICLFNAVGSLTLNRSLYACTDTLAITMLDDNLRGLGTYTVTVESTTEPAPETVTLTEDPGRPGRFLGTFPVAAVPVVNGDGTLSVAAGDTVTVTYIDADDGGGGVNIPRTTTAAIDCTGPVITNVQASNVTGNSATITWDTNEPANSVIHYGLAPPGGGTASSAALVVAHSLRATGLVPCSLYYYWVESTDTAGNGALENNGGAYYTFTTGTNSTPTYAYAGAPLPIPDNTPAGASATIAVTDISQILDVNVKVNISHTFDGDLVLELTGPDGTKVILANRRGSSGENFVDTVFDDAAATSITTGTAPFTGSFRPEEALSVFNNKFANGTWTLKVTDQAGIDVGTLNGFELTFEYGSVPCGQPLLRRYEYSVAESCSGTGSGGDNVVDPGEDVSIPYRLVNTGAGVATGVSATLSTTTPGVIVTTATSVYADMPIGAFAYGAAPFVARIGDGVPCGTVVSFAVAIVSNEGTWNETFSLRVGSPVFFSNTYPSTDTPKPIPDVRTPPVTSPIVIADTGVVGDVNVTINLTHTWDSDLDIFLIGPNGTRVELSTDNGSSSDDFTGTVFDDQAAVSITAGTAPFTGSFKPEGSLATLNGIPANGTWTLEITDDTGGDSGNLLGWSLQLTTPGGYSCNACAGTALPPGEVARMLFSAKDTAEWTAAILATEYRVYRGTDIDMPKVLTVDVDSCQHTTTAALTTSGIVEDPATGSFWWWLVRAANTAGVGPAGLATAGPRIHDSSGVCP